MKIQIQNLNQNTIYLLLGLIILSPLVLLLQPASAASAGCYARSPTGSSIVIDYLDCPSEEYQREVSNGKCFIFASGSGGVAPTGTETDCDALVVGSVPIQTPVVVDENVDFTFSEGEYQCGTNDNAVKTSLSFGCKGATIEATGGEINPIVDMAFAVFRVLSAGVGLVVIGSIIFAGIQYSASRDNPQATEASMKRVTNSVIALLFYALLFSIANFLVPGGMFI